MSASRKTVLFVDDDAEFIDLMRTLAQDAKGEQWHVLTATTTANALRLLGGHPVDLAVFDLRMPIVDGIQFLQLVHRKYPNMRKALLSSYPDDARRQNALQYGAELILTKPLNAMGYDILFETLDELTRTQNEEGFRGTLRKIGLEDIVQMECLSRHTALIEVVTAGERGRIYIQTGKLVHAEFGELQGEAALNRLLALRGGEFHHAPFTEPPTRTLQDSWEFLLMEAARHRDEMLAAADAPISAPAENAPSSRVREIVITSERGELLHERGCAAAAERAQVMRVLHGVGERLTESAPFGPLERVEFSSDGEQTIVRLAPGGAVWVKGAAE
jgi:CheY-like chemotaxis protein